MVKLRSRTWILLGVIIILVTAASAIILQEHPSNTTNSSNQQQVQNLEPTNQINITVKTNGTTTTVQAASDPISSKVPDKMINEMKNKAYNDVQSDTSTVSSLKADMQTIAQKYNYTADVTIISQFGTDQLPFPATVSGTSMIPTLRDGQSVIALKTSDFKVGNIVISHHPTYGLIIKRVAAIKNGKVFLKSDNRQVQTFNTETPLPNGVVEVSTITKTPLDTWQPIKNVIGVVKTY